MTSTLEKAFFIPLLISLAILASQTKSRTLDEPSIAQIFEQWMVHYGRNYLNSTEKNMRFQIFKNNYEYILKFNSAGNNTYKLGINQFSDLTTEQFLASYTGFQMPPNPRVYKTASYRNQNLNEEVPESFDWRDQGAVTNIKDQGPCACCWAFAAVAAMESAIKIKTGQMPVLSEQQLLDCDKSNNGCEGGTMDKAFDYIIQNGGLAAESDYPYMQKAGICDPQKATNAAATISGYQDVPSDNEQELKIAVYHQPVSAAISIGEDFKQYKGGVFHGGCGERLNHAVTIVGYGISKENGIEYKYWLIKNSWGPWAWGENGYMKIIRESGSPDGHCGLATHPSYPIV